jgi:cytochrome c-type biogenesis protein CcmH
MLLWILIGMITAAVTAVLAWPLLSRRSVATRANDELAARLAVFRDRRDEIRRERDAGRLGEDEARQAEADLLAQMADELPAEWLDRAGAPDRPGPTAAASSGSRAPSLVVAAIVIACVPLVGVGVYQVVGSPEIAVAQSQGLLGPQAGDPRQQIDAMLAELDRRVNANPRDGEAWAMLAETRRMLGDHGNAVEAFARAIPLLAPNARLLADYAESTALLAGGEFAGKPTELLEQALRIDPKEPKTIGLIGVARYRAGELEQARRFMGRLLDTLQPGTPDAAQVAQIVERIDAEIAARATPQSASPAARLRGTVSLSPGLQSRLAPNSTLFVVARASQGPRIPVAVLRVPVASLPFEFELGDAQAMDPSRPLSGVGAVVIEARLSESGQAMRQPGDLYSEAVEAMPGASGIRLLIDRIAQP